MTILRTVAECLRRQRLTVSVAEDIDAGADGVPEGDEDVGAFGRGEGDAFPVLRGVVVLVQEDVIAYVGARAVVVGGAFGGETGVAVVAGEGARGEGGEDDGVGTHGGVILWVFMMLWFCGCW